MSEYIEKSDALDILDQFEDAVENGEGGFFYSKAREMMCNLPSEEIIHCKDCKFYTPMNREIKTGICDLTLHQNFGDDWYCAGAERK